MTSQLLQTCGVSSQTVCRSLVISCSWVSGWASIICVHILVYNLLNCRISRWVCKTSARLSTTDLFFHLIVKEKESISLNDVGDLLQNLIGDFYSPLYLTDQRYNRLNSDDILGMNASRPKSRMGRHQSSQRLVRLSVWPKSCPSLEVVSHWCHDLNFRVLLPRLSTAATAKTRSTRLIWQWRRRVRAQPWHLAVMRFWRSLK